MTPQMICQKKTVVTIWVESVLGFDSSSEFF